MLYGVAQYGGALGAGGIYRVAPDSSLFELLYSFDGGFPYGGVTVGSDGALYGTTFDTSQIFRFVPPTTCGGSGAASTPAAAAASDPGRAALEDFRTRVAGGATFHTSAGDF